MTRLFRILTIIPEINQTIVAVFHNELCIYKEAINHLLPYPYDQKSLMNHVKVRKELVINKLVQAGINLSKLDAISTIGGILKPVEGGTYLINETIIQDLMRSYNGKHISNLGALIAFEIANKLNIDAYIVDPPVVDELSEEAKYTGVPSIKRKSIFHAINQKQVARLAANELNKSYQDVNFIICHLGIGITIGAHQKGKIIDVNNGLHGDGPFSIERSGSLPLNSLISLCFSNRYTKEDILEKLTFHSGLKAYFQTENVDTIMKRIRDANEDDLPIIQALTYQIAKEIGSMAAVLNGNIDGIVLTGILAEIELINQLIIERTSWIADIFIFPGEYALQALHEGTLRVLRNEENAKHYS